MKVKKFVVKNMNEAMVKIKNELGSNAVIMEQRKIRQPGLKGFFSKRLIEVTAASESEDYDSFILKNSLEAIRKASVYESSNNSSIKYNKNNEENEYKNKKILEEVQEMKELIKNISYSEEKVNELEEALEKNDVNREIIKEIFSKKKDIKEDIDDEEKVKNIIFNMININYKENYEENEKIVLVGPTGVGKTTTIAKLAGRLSLIENKKVGLITIDTYRIGAIEQLKTYSEIMDIPFRVVLNLNDMEEALNLMKDRDIILIDTTGRSSKNFMQISELRAFIEKSKAKNINLVVSCTTKNNDIKPIIDGYSKLQFNNIIITKLDETNTYGSILNIAHEAKKPISFFTTGQNVPDDVKRLKKEEIIKLILGEDNIC